MYPVVVDPDVELWATGWLRTFLAGRSESCAADVVVDRTVPDPRPPRLVTVRHDGGPRQDVLHTAARLGVNVWADDEQDCSDLARLCLAGFLSVRSTSPVEVATGLSSIQTIADPSKTPRRYFTVELLIRGAVA